MAQMISLFVGTFTTLLAIINPPVGAGIGKLWRLGKIGLPLNTQIVPYYNAVTPDFGPDWQLRFQLQFLFRR